MCDTVAWRLDAGSKTMSGDHLESGEQQDCGWIVGRPPSVRFTEMSEERGHLDLAEGATLLRVGDRVQVVPNHVCPAVNLRGAYVGVRGGQVEEIFTTDARGCVR